MSPRPCCPGLFHGAIPLPLPVSCDTVHATLGLAAGAAPLPGTRRALCALFVFYQAVEELPGGDVRSFVKDVAVFAVGLALGCALRRTAAAAAAHHRARGTPGG